MANKTDLGKEQPEDQFHKVIQQNPIKLYGYQNPKKKRKKKKEDQEQFF